MRNLQLKNLRKQAGYGTQADLARVLGANPRTYASWEREEVGLSLYEAGRIADVLGCSLDERQAGRCPPAASPTLAAEMNVLFAQLDETRKAFLQKRPGAGCRAHRRAD
ncbi:MAG: helix-turn-helix transcriptional regulator [Eggerthellaceae bacterium]